MKLRTVVGEAELRRVDQLLQTAYRSPTRLRELALYPAAQPDGLFAIFDHDEPVAAAGAIAYGTFCWLGLVATRPGYSGQGLATRLSEHLIDWSRAHGCLTVALDASDAGRPVYERLGFEPAGETIELVADAGQGFSIQRGPDGPAEPDGLAAGPTAWLTDVPEFDRGIFGGDREALLRALAADGSRVYRQPGPDGRIAGYLFARGHVIGPGAARDADAAAALAAAALTHAAGPVTLIVPASSAYRQTLRDLGLRERRRLTHMRLGEQQLPGQRAMLVAQTSFAAG